MLIKVAVGLAVILVLAAGLLPALLDRGNLANDALNAAQAGSAILVSTGNASQAQAAASQSISADHGVVLQDIQVDPGGQQNTVKVSVEEQIHTFMSGWPGIKSWLASWFHLTSTQTSSVGT